MRGEEEGELSKRGLHFLQQPMRKNVRGGTVSHVDQGGLTKQYFGETSYTLYQRGKEHWNTEAKQIN